jgi:hypothetical protein
MRRIESGAAYTLTAARRFGRRRISPSARAPSAARSVRRRAANRPPRSPARRPRSPRSARSPRARQAGPVRRVRAGAGTRGAATLQRNICSRSSTPSTSGSAARTTRDARSSMSSSKRAPDTRAAVDRDGRSTRPRGSAARSGDGTPPDHANPTPSESIASRPHPGVPAHRTPPERRPRWQS